MTNRYAELEGLFGGPSDQGFGSAVFRRPVAPDAYLETVALDVYQFFVGKMWARFGPDAWLSTFAERASRDSKGNGKIIDMLQSLDDPTARSAAAFLLDGSPDSAASGSVLEAAFDHAGIPELKIYSIGDGEAMSGLLVAAHDTECNEVVLLTFLID